MMKYWIYQFGPKRYDSSYMDNAQSIEFSSDAKGIDQFQKGDKVFVWRSSGYKTIYLKSYCGIVQCGTVSDTSKKVNNTVTFNLKFTQALEINIKTEATLTRHELEKVPILKSIGYVRKGYSSQFTSINEEQYKELCRLWKGKTTREYNKEQETTKKESSSKEISSGEDEPFKKIMKGVEKLKEEHEKSSNDGSSIEKRHNSGISKSNTSEENSEDIQEETSSNQEPSQQLRPPVSKEHEQLSSSCSISKSSTNFIMSALKKQQWYAILQNQTITFEEDEVIGDGWCTLNAIGIANPKQALSNLQTNLDDPAIRYVLSCAIEDNWHAHKTLNESFTLNEIDAQENDMLIKIRSLWQTLQAFPPEATNTPPQQQALANFMNYLSCREVLTAYLQGLQRSKYVNSHIADACLKLQGKKLAVFRNDHKNRDKGQLSTDAKSVPDKNTVCVIFHPSLTQWGAHYNTLKILEIRRVSSLSQPIQETQNDPLETPKEQKTKETESPPTAIMSSGGNNSSGKSSHPGKRPLESNTDDDEKDTAKPSPSKRGRQSTDQPPDSVPKNPEISDYKFGQKYGSKKNLYGLPEIVLF